MVGARVVGHRGEDDRHEAALVRERLEEVARRTADVAPLGSRIGEHLQRELDVEGLALRRELVRLEPVAETAVAFPVGEHRGVTTPWTSPSSNKPANNRRSSTRPER